jgi:hypothetical protein
MNRRTRFTIAVTGVVACAAVGTGVAVASGGDDSGGPITGPALATASQAALTATGGGRVTETEVGDEESYYQVEVTLDDGRQVDVQLDEAFRVVGTKTEAADGAEGADDADGD